MKLHIYDHIMIFNVRTYYLIYGITIKMLYFVMDISTILSFLAYVMIHTPTLEAYINILLRTISCAQYWKNILRK